jgi:hypothetical protein
MNAYPFDEQNIKMSLESWSFTSDIIHVECDEEDPVGIIEEAFVDNVEWKVLSVQEENQFMSYSSGDYTRVVFYFNIERQGMTIEKTVILPALFVACLAFFYYFIPIGTGDRTNFLATILLTIIMFLVMLTTFVPVSKSTSGIVDMFFNLTIILFALIIVVLFMDWYHNIINPEKDDDEEEQVKEDEEAKKKKPDENEEEDNELKGIQLRKKRTLSVVIQKCMTPKRFALLDKILAIISFIVYVIIVIINMTAH